MPYDPGTKNTGLLTAPPQRIHFFGAGGLSLRPFVYAYTIGWTGLERVVRSKLLSLRHLRSLRRQGNQGIVVVIRVLAPYQHRSYQVVDALLFQSLNVELDLGSGKS